MEHVLSVSLDIISLMMVLVRCVIITHAALAEGSCLMLNTACLATTITLNVLNVNMGSTRTLVVLVSTALFPTVLSVVQMEHVLSVNLAIISLMKRLVRDVTTTLVVLAEA
jgi:hypothetical protein